MFVSMGGNRSRARRQSDHTGAFNNYPFSCAQTCQDLHKLSVTGAQGHLAHVKTLTGYLQIDVEYSLLLN